MTRVVSLCLFFFQAEDGIRDYKVTGVQTCALPICFRADEWERSLVADALLRSDVAFANEFFFARMLDPTGVENTPRRVAIGANHGGEFLHLLQTAPRRTTMRRADRATAAPLTDPPGGPPPPA